MFLGVKVHPKLKTFFLKARNNWYAVSNILVILLFIINSKYRFFDSSILAAISLGLSSKVLLSKPLSKKSQINNKNESSYDFSKKENAIKGRIRKVKDYHDTLS